MSTTTKNILVIDDDFHLLVGIKALLEREGYGVFASTDGISGMSMARQNDPDLIICDVMMPFMDGFRFREELKADPVTENIPFLFISARVSQTDKLRGLNTGADDYITKPFDHRELLARVSTIINRYEKGREDMRRRMESEISHVKQEISHNVSHELRTPLTQVLLALDMILRNKYSNPQEVREFLDIAMSQSQRLNCIIDDLIFLNDHERGALNTIRQRIEVKNDFMEVIRIRRDLYAEKALAVQVRAAPDVVIHAPRREFRQVISHLVDNALKFSRPQGNILIDLEREGMGGFMLTITDEGPGIPEALRETVFKPYYQVSQGDTRSFNGLGVGLTIARIVTRSLGGDTVILPGEAGCRVQAKISPGRLDLY